jgi:hypothetical protein
MKYEHVNTAADIEAVLKHFFHQVKGSVFGLSKGLAFYRFYECSEVKTDALETYLKRS